MVLQDLINKIYQMEKELQNIRQELLQQYKLENQMKNYCVYYHLLPNGKYYIGVAKDPKQRWKNGAGYFSNKQFYKDIKKYGWKNIKHQILCKTIERSHAESIEQFLISLYNSTNPNYGYNRWSFLGEGILKGEVRNSLEKSLFNKLNEDGSEYNEKYLQELDEAYKQNIARTG